MRCFNSPKPRMTSQTLQCMNTILRDTERLHDEIRNASNNGRNIGFTYLDVFILKEDLQNKIMTRSEANSTDYYARLSSISNQFNALAYPVAETVKNDQAARSRGDRERG